MDNAKTNYFEYLTGQDIEQIHLASLYILENFGVKVDDPELRKNLYSIGCQVEGDRVKFNNELIGKVIANAADNIQLVGRSGNSVEIKQGNVVSHSTGGMPGIIDFETGKKRDASLSDLIKALRLMDNLDQLDMPCAIISPMDVPKEISQIVQLEHMLKYTTKPIYGPGISTASEAAYVVELFKVFSGSHKTNPVQQFGLVGISPQSPLYFPKDITDTMEIIISAHIPTVMLSAPVVGLSCPFTIAGGVAQMNAEMLAFATIAFLFNSHTPLIYGARLNYLNMKNGTSIWGLPEIGMANVVVAQLARYYGFLTDTYGLSCTSCAFDNQTGYEKAINGILPVIAGANMISGFGSLASLMVASYEQLVIDNEIFAIMRRVLKGVTVNQDTLALEVISRVLDGETFIEQEHTVRHLRAGEVFLPTLGFDHSWSIWDSTGRKDIRDKAKELAHDLLLNDSYTPLPENIEKEINHIVKSAYEELVEK